MKISRECLKCKSHDIVKIPGNKNTAEGRILLNMWGTKVILIDKYICTNCGYFEDYGSIDRAALKLLNELKEKNDDDFDEFV